MHAPSIGLAPEGLPIIGLTALSSLIFALIGYWPLAIIFLLACWFSCHFFRDPERVIPSGSGLGVSPADGKIVSIKPVQDPISGEIRLRISIFMNVFSVHVNRSPVSATVTAINYYPGKFVNAAFDKASTENERCAYSLLDDQGEQWCMVQIAGLIARRIVCRVEAGEHLQRGQRFGLIRFGSRVDVYLPDSYSPAVIVGEQVFAGQSILAQRGESTI